MKTKLYKVKPRFAQMKNLPIYFVANQLIETSKAVYLHGRGTTETARMGICCKCGRTLTHPVSVELGIGPVCGQHWHDWDLIGGFTKENLERLKGAMQEIKVDTWVPKSTIQEELETEDAVTTPKDHPKLKPKAEIPRQATMVRSKRTGVYGIKITFPFNEEDLRNVRTLPDRKFSQEHKFWTCPLSVEAVEKLQSFKFSIDEHLQKWLEENKVHINDVTEIDVPGLKGTLYPFQKKGVAFLERKRGRALIADEMGLGKTIQALAFLQLHPELRPVIVVVPASLKLNWQREINTWMTEKYTTQILSGTKSHKFSVTDFIIINYDVLSHWIERIKTINPQVMIVDEIHYTKNNSAKRTKAVKSLAKHVPHVIGLSGTPIVNRPVEAYNCIKMIDNAAMPNYWDYTRRYCNRKYNGYGWDVSGASNTEELHERLTNTVMLRRKKADVLKDLPDKVYSYVPMELQNRDEYTSAENNFIGFVRRQKGLAAAERAGNAQALAEIEGLKQLAVKGKLKAAVDWISNFLDVDGKLVVFCVHKFVVDELMNVFADKAVKVDGSVTGENRQKAVDDFQTKDNIRLFVGNVKAAGVGITLTASSNVAFLELPWTPGDVTQAEDRCHRIGQKNSVNIHYLLANDTIESRIAKLLDKKRKVLDSVLDGKVTETESLLSELMNQFE